MKKLILLAALFLGCLPAMAVIPEGGANGSCGENLTWTLSKDGTLTISGTGTKMTNYERGKDASDNDTANTPWWEYRTDIKTLILPEGLEYIGGCAFFQCTAIEGSLHLPSTLKSIQPCAFEGCVGLTGSLNFPSTLKQIMYRAFKGCAGLTGALIIPDLVTEIGSYAFNGCSGLSSLWFPSNLSLLSQESFKLCSGIKFIISERTSAQTITNTVFEGVADSIPLYVPSGSYNSYYYTNGAWQKFKIKEVTISGKCGDNLVYVLCDDTLTISGSGEMTDFSSEDVPWKAYNSNIKSLSLPEGLTSIGMSAFQNCSGLTGSLSFPEGLTHIKFCAFNGCSKLSSLSFPSSLTNIEGGAFQNCSGLSGSLSFPDGFTSFGDYAFSGCNRISSLSFPSSLTTIGEYVFLDCSGIVSIQNRRSEPQDIKANVFNGLTLSNITLYVPVTAIEAYKGHNVWKQFDIKGTYTVTVVASPAECGTVSGEGEYTENSTVTLTATANPHYHFVKWNDGALANPRTITVVQDTTFTAYFAIDSFTVTVVSANEAYGTVSGGGEYPYGGEASLSAAAKEGYKFTQWKEDGNTDNPRTVTVTADTSFTAVFEQEVVPEPEPEDTLYVITVKSNNEEWGIASGGGTFKKDTTVTIKAQAFSGYKFVKWKEDNNTEATRQVKVTANATYTAEFAEEEGPGVDNASTNSLTATRVYPNPNNGRFTIDVAEPARMEVYNAAGIRVMSAELTVGKREVSLPTTGIYFIKLTAGDRSDCANRSERSTVKRVVVR